MPSCRTDTRRADTLYRAVELLGYAYRDQDFRQRRQIAQRNGWVRNTAWLEQVRNYHGHHTRAAWLLLGYVPRYRSFNTKWRVTGIDSLLFEERTRVEQVTVAVPSERLIKSGEQASASCSYSELAETAVAEAGTSSQPRRAVVPSSSEEDEERMLHRRRQRFVVEDLESLAFEDVGGAASDAPQHAGDAPASPPLAVAEIALAPYLRRQSSLMTRPLDFLQGQEVESTLPRSRRRDGQRRGPGLRPRPVLHRHHPVFLHRHRPVRKHPSPLRRSYGDRTLRLREEVKEGAIQSASLAANLNKALAEVEELEADAHMLRRTNTDLVTETNQARTQLEAALEDKAAQLESALAKQKAKLEEKYGAEFDAAMEEGMRELTADYKAQLQRIRALAWVLGWKAALTKVGVTEDDPGFRNPPKFPSSGFVASSSADSPSAPEVPPDTPSEVDAAHEACSFTSEAVPTDSKTGLPEIEAHQGIDCNVEAVSRGAEVDALGIFPAFSLTGGSVLGSITKCTFECWFCCRNVAGAVIELWVAGTFTKPNEAGTDAEVVAGAITELGVASTLTEPGRVLSPSPKEPATGAEL
ncbi:hypothetical protein AAC387_Pa02g2243 [Persea americana]